jgi:hypothetical protein
MIDATGQIFISYSRQDYYLAESLSLQLASRGVSAWMDVLELQPGADWERSLFDAIDGCAAGRPCRPCAGIGCCTTRPTRLWRTACARCWRDKARQHRIRFGHFWPGNAAQARARARTGTSAGFLCHCGPPRTAMGFI